MKKFNCIALGLLALLLCAGNSLAVTIPVDGSITYRNFTWTDDMWSTGSFAPTGTGAISLTLSFTANGLSGSGLEGLYITGAYTDPDKLRVIPVNASMTNYTNIVVPVQTNGSGLYSFTAYLLGDPDGATWSMKSASLTGSIPTSTPIPAAALLLGSGVLGLFGIGKARSRRNS